ncbi:hypothetical protein FOZ61_003229 [Perkinsus olseni]|uniref:Uncharacterized protein n=1 Tax=Perkinsus olseni TaxID=32597 RepID=A0A7J6MIN5_PEROL|nr:hypothetical protein FOZ61_003229 [Perkinsus olseni]
MSLNVPRLGFHAEEPSPPQRPTFRAIASTWALLFMGMMLVTWLVDVVARSSQTVSIDREVLKALQSAVHEVVKDQKDLVSRVDDQYLDLLSRINDLSTGVRKMSNVFREPLAAGKLEEIIQVEGGEGRTTMVFCIVSAFLAVLMHFTLSRRDGPLTVGRSEDSTSLRRCEQATLQCDVMNPPPAYNPEVVPIDYTPAEEDPFDDAENRSERASAERLRGVHGIPEYTRYSPLWPPLLLRSVPYKTQAIYRSFVCTSTNRTCGRPRYESSVRTTMPPFVSNYQRYIAVYGGEDSEEKPTGLMMGSLYEVGTS